MSNIRYLACGLATMAFAFLISAGTASNGPFTHSLDDDRLAAVRAGACECPANLQVVSSACLLATNGLCTGAATATACGDVGACGEAWCEGGLKPTNTLSLCGDWPDHPTNGCRMSATKTKDCGKKHTDGVCKWYDVDGGGIGPINPLPTACYCSAGTAVAGGCAKQPTAEACTPPAPPAP
jgi:hypothetical protein